jgi:hypothetical protein
VSRERVPGVRTLVADLGEHQLDVGADLLGGLPDRCGGGRLAQVHGAAQDTPAVVMAGMADQQHPACLIDGQDRHGRQEQQLMPDDGSQPGYMRSDTHLGNPAAPGGRPRPERSGSIIGPDNARTGLFTLKKMK